MNSPRAPGANGPARLPLSGGANLPLDELAARCEQATGPDRELDVRIAVAVDWRWDNWEDGEPTALTTATKRGIEWLLSRAAKHMTIWRHLPRYTASLDAAMTLVPEGWARRIEYWSRPEGQADIASDDGPSAKAVLMECSLKRIGKQQIWGFHTPGSKSVEVRAATEALALCAAALRSIAASERTA